MEPTPTATDVEYHTSPPLDPAPNPSTINTNNSTKSPTDTFDGHGTDDTDCFGTVIDIIKSLHVPKPTCDSHQNTGTAQVSGVDVVLTRNKQVCEELTGFLGMLLRVKHSSR